VTDPHRPLPAALAPHPDLAGPPGPRHRGRGHRGSNRSRPAPTPGCPSPAAPRGPPRRDGPRTTRHGSTRPASKVQRCWKRHRLIGHLRRPELRHRAGQVLLDGQPPEELPQGPVLLIRVSLAVPLEQPRHPPSHIRRAHLLPPGLIRPREQMRDGEPARRVGVDPDRSRSLVLRRQVQPEGRDIRRERPRIQRTRTPHPPRPRRQSFTLVPGVRHRLGTTSGASGPTRTCRSHFRCFPCSCTDKGKRANRPKEPSAPTATRTRDLPLRRR
jgi:hypothetical protein